MIKTNIANSLQMEPTMLRQNQCLVKARNHFANACSKKDTKSNKGICPPCVGRRVLSS